MRTAQFTLPGCQPQIQGPRHGLGGHTSSFRYIYSVVWMYKALRILRKQLRYDREIDK
ncbi:hypothetical protein PILCRDRAFT_740884 [Piloderma croceum F 1598]|uniref:Uncharacterized protein n=1 Tax=Piloderma croceum (strain F 1598) TaxID=765440 RepID=A0A0C3EIJ7_PILCF|nr:hypothetical protein PILCRDRAFT_740884 [Piloderma croceum F 1598]